MHRALQLFTLISLSFLLPVTVVYAVTVPSFPSCTNPQGTVKASYSNGTHGIVGSTATHTGSDTVYSVSDTTLTQCFCSVSGDGIQTNWWKVSSLTEADIKVLLNRGWTYVPSGTPWGLNQGAYLTTNTNYNCLPPTNNNGGGGGIGGGDGRSDGRGEGQVLGLATTGDALFVYAVIILGVTFLAVGILAKRFHDK